jgi:DNA-binding CsgD family transcriptional regulator
VLLAAADAIEGRPSSDVRSTVNRAWGGRMLLDALGPEHIICLFCETALCVARELRAVESIATQVADRAGADGSVRGVIHAWMWRAFAREGMGRLADAEADADLTLQMTTPGSWNVAEAAVQGVRARISVERGDLAGAREQLARLDPGTDVFINRIGFLVTTAKLARAAGVRAEELHALRTIQAISTDGEFGTWLLGCWPADLALALGPCDEAREIAAAALRGARTRGLPAEIGIALRAQALVAGERPDIERLQAAVGELERSDMAIEHARGLVELGAALRRHGHRSDAREPLALGLERAQRCGATALAQRALTELQATGARPRRLVLTGADALTPSERRIAILAAEGRSNREIAQTLFVTTKTVETHLSHIYRKLDISGRTQLSAVLAAA